MTERSEKNGNLLLNRYGVNKEAPSSIESLGSDEILSRLAKMNIVLLGIPGAGKTTLSAELMDRSSDIDYISVGDISRNLDPNSPERLYLNELFKGEAPTGDPNFFLRLIEGRIDAAKERGSGFILDGIPKKAVEVQPLLDFFVAKNINVDAVVSCEIPPVEAYNRIATRDDRAGDEDSMTVFMNRTKIYLEDIDKFKNLLTANGAPLFTIDTATLNQEQCVDHLLAAARLVIGGEERVSCDLAKITENLRLEEVGKAAAELAPLFDDTFRSGSPYESLFSNKISTDEKRVIIQELLLAQDPALRHTPLLAARLADNYMATTLGSIEHLIASVIEETSALGRPINENDVQSLIQEQLETKQLIADLQAELIDGKDFSEVIDEEVVVNKDELQYISKKLEDMAEQAGYGGLSLDPDSIMRLQPSLWGQLTSNKILFSPDSNYRRTANGVAGSHHSLLPFSKPNRALGANSMSDYLPFIEAVSSSDYKYTSTFGFIHLIGMDQTGESYGVEYPIMMHDKRLLALNNERLNKMLSSIDAFYSTHDIWHNIVPVYADHFILHHPDAPLSYGGRMSSYLEFGRKKRQEKEEYEIGVAMAHAKTQQERFIENPHLRTQQEDIIMNTLDDLPLLREELEQAISAEEVDDVIDFLSARAVSNLYNVIPPSDPIYEALDQKLKDLKLPALKVSLQQVAALIVQQKLVEYDQSIDFRDLSVDVSKQIIASLNIDLPERESGSEHIVKALADFGIIDEFLDGEDEIALDGMNKVRWIAMMAPQRAQLKGHMEKVHGKNGAYKYGDEILSDSRYLVHLQQQALRNDMPHYLYRTHARKEGQQISYGAYSVFFDDNQDMNRLERTRLNAMLEGADANEKHIAEEVIGQLDEMIDALVKSTYAFKGESIGNLLDIASVLRQSTSTAQLGDTLNDLTIRYRDLRESEIRYQQSIGVTYVEAAEKIIEEQMSIS